VADVFVVNKSDTPGAKDVRRDLEFMLDLGHVSGHEARRGSRPNIVNTSGISGDGVDEVLAEAAKHLEQLSTNGQLADRRKRRIGLEIRSHLQQQLEQTVDTLIEGTVGAAHIDQVADGSMRPSEAVQALHNRLYDD
jgi:LAO/AO transport system kinase